MTNDTVRRALRPRRDDGGKRGIGTFVRDVLVIFLAALLISFLIKTFLIRSFYIPSGSMEQTLQINDRIIVNELVPDLVDVKRGDVVVFTDPGGWLDGTAPISTTTGNPVSDGFSWFLTLVGLGAQDSNDHLIKRVIGLPGDTVECCNDFGQMSVNGVPLDEPYVNLPPGETRVSADDFSVTVPADSLWVMGDNRYNSKDSRYNGATPSKGFVPMSDVVGRAFVISWPTERWTWLGDYPDVFRGTEREGE
ncbi:MULTISPECIES: signal peptidase I [unclassified Frigoribacterium]|jgi:signal peptidase I|uniref:signal peptidase I n=1 Tax=unclassified Frigoribacterium TaxID=2627005 RepID=UPI0006F373F1|nr:MULTISPECIES: signal peptidase I [unclassified Frigoribacterium]KQM25485.1 S26 family signal peptidase [Frigoribacterium sp. Leaf8]MBD8140356.1 signal peptidase I [Frigoribacterium sp. CFBP 13605]MBD8485174.1 signal peptidase I [Frigoribacterium sp. CFBP 8759]NQW86390.1 signal peptidase I [Frigoribacterium sp. VKM Ac-2860]NQX07722.1 signal peptidase I [Frigoribacterium sp. VKM Ac-2859]